MGRFRNPCSKTQCKKKYQRPKRVNIMFPFADGTEKLCGRDHGVRESTPSQQQLVGNLGEELQRNSDGSQPTETKEMRHP